MGIVRRLSLAIAYEALACHPHPTPAVTQVPAAPAPAVVPHASLASDAPGDRVAAKVEFVVADALVSSRGPVAMGKLTAGSIEVDDELHVADSDPPIMLRVLAVEEFRKPGTTGPAHAVDVGLLLALPEGIALDVLARGTVLVRATPAAR